MASCHRLFLCSPPVAPSFEQVCKAALLAVAVCRGGAETCEWTTFSYSTARLPSDFFWPKGELSMHWKFSLQSPVFLSSAVSTEWPSWELLLHPRIKRHIDLKRGLAKIKLIHRLGDKKILLPMNF